MKKKKSQRPNYQHGKEKEPNYHHGKEKEPKAKFITMEKKRAKGQIKLSTSSLCARLRFIQLPVVILMNFVNCPLCVPVLPTLQTGSFL